MAEKDVDEQFAAIVAHWEEEALGLDPFGDPSEPSDPSEPVPGPSTDADDRDVEDVEDLPHDVPDHTPGERVEETPGPVEDARSRGDRPVLPSPQDPAPPRSDVGTGEAAATRESGVSRPPPRAAPSETGAAAARPGAVDDEGSAPLPGSAWRRHDPAEVEEHFEPPPPAPLPSSEDRHFWTMVGALIGGPLLFLYLLLFNRDGNGWWMTFALLASVAGFVLLVLRQPNERDEDDDGVRL